MSAINANPARSPSRQGSRLFGGPKTSEATKPWRALRGSRHRTAARFPACERYPRPWPTTVAGCRPCSLNCSNRRAASACSRTVVAIALTLACATAGSGGREGGTVCRTGSKGSSFSQSGAGGDPPRAASGMGGGAGIGAGGSSPMSRRRVSSRVSAPGGLPAEGEGSSPSVGGPACFSSRRFDSQLTSAPTMTTTATIHGLSNKLTANRAFIWMATPRQVFAPCAPGDDDSGPSLPMFSRMFVSA